MFLKKSENQFMSNFLFFLPKSSKSPKIYSLIQRSRLKIIYIYYITDIP